MTAPEGVPGGLGIAELLPQPQGSPAGEGEHSHPHPLRAGWCLWHPPAIILCRLSPCLRAPGAALARFASSQRSVPCPGSGPRQPEHSQGGHGHNAPGAAAGGFPAWFFWLLVSLKSFLVGL